MPSHQLTLPFSQGELYMYILFFMDTATTEIYTLSLHDALPICMRTPRAVTSRTMRSAAAIGSRGYQGRSEEHTSELQSQSKLVCRPLLEKKKGNSQANLIFLPPLLTSNEPSHRLRPVRPLLLSL